MPLSSIDDQLNQLWPEWKKSRSRQSTVGPDAGSRYPSFAAEANSVPLSRVNSIPGATSVYSQSIPPSPRSFHPYQPTPRQSSASLRSPSVSSVSRPFVASALLSPVFSTAIARGFPPSQSELLDTMEHQTLGQSSQSLTRRSSAMSASESTIQQKVVDYHRAERERWTAAESLYQQQVRMLADTVNTLKARISSQPTATEHAPVIPPQIPPQAFVSVSYPQTSYPQTMQPQPLTPSHLTTQPYLPGYVPPVPHSIYVDNPPPPTAFPYGYQAPPHHLYGVGSYYPPNVIPVTVEKAPRPSYSEYSGRDPQQGEDQQTLYEQRLMSQPSAMSVRPPSEQGDFQSQQQQQERQPYRIGSQHQEVSQQSQQQHGTGQYDSQPQSIPETQMVQPDKSESPRVRSPILQTRIRLDDPVTDDEETSDTEAIPARRSNLSRYSMGTIGHGKMLIGGTAKAKSVRAERVITALTRARAADAYMIEQLQKEKLALEKKTQALKKKAQKTAILERTVQNAAVSIDKSEKLMIRQSQYIAQLKATTAQMASEASDLRGTKKTVKRRSASVQRQR